MNPPDEGIDPYEWQAGIDRIAHLLVNRILAMSAAEQQQFMQNLSPGEQQALQALTAIYEVQQTFGTGNSLERGGETAAPTAAPAAKTTVAPTPGPQTVEVQYAYDNAGRLTQADYGSVVIKYKYDKTGNVVGKEVMKK